MKSDTDKPEQKPETPHAGDALPMRSTIPGMVRPALTPHEARRREELASRGPQTKEEADELDHLKKKGDVPQPLSVVGQNRLMQLWAREHAKLTPEEAAELTRLEAEASDHPAAQARIAQLRANGPLSKDEIEEMRLLQEAHDRHEKFQKDAEAMRVKEGSGPFTPEQWRHLTEWVRKEMELAHQYPARVRREMHP
jgi:hypothetical protein